MTLDPPRFELGEIMFKFGYYSWRLKDGQIRYRVTGSFRGIIIEPIASDEFKLKRFVAALDLLDVWNWKSLYSTDDTDCLVFDGGVWWFKADFSGRSCNTKGKNAYPGFDDPQNTVLSKERFSLLCASFYDVFAIESFICKQQT